MKALLPLALAGLLTLWGWIGRRESPARPTAASTGSEVADPLVPPILLADLEDPFAHDRGALFEPHGDRVCASGCAVSRHPTASLSSRRYSELLAAYAQAPVGAPTAALDALLFYGRQTQVWADRKGWGPLTKDQVEFLQGQLSRTHVRVAIRVVDEQGRTRSQLSRTRVPLDRRHVFDMQRHDLPPLVTSGTVKRVGLDHLWTRL